MKKNPTHRQRTALTIAGTDPTGGAGIQADLRAFEAMGVRGASVVSAVTAQDSRGVQGVFPVSGEAFSRQLEVVLNDRRIDAVKTGMLLTAENVRIAARFFRDSPPPILVVDPVFRSSDGAVLLEEEGVRVLIRDLLPSATVVTPNLAEAGDLSGLDRKEERGEPEWIREMARAILERGPAAVIITGGHLQGKPSDLLFDGVDFFTVTSPRIPGEVHGSGCSFSSALCAGLALGFSLKEALSRAKEYTLTLFRSQG